MAAGISTDSGGEWTIDRIVRTLLDAVPFVAFVKDEDGRYVYANPACLRLIGQSMVGLTDEQIFPESTARVNRQNDRHVLTTGDVMRSMETIVTPEGVSREWSSLKFAFTSPTGQRLIGGVVTDVTEQRRSQRTVAESQRRLKAAQEAGYDSFFALDAVRNAEGHIEDFIFQDLNRNAEKLLGRTRWEIIGKRMTDVLRVARGPEGINRYVRVVESAKPLEDEYPIAGGESGTRWFRQQVVPLGDGIAITTREITDQKRVEAVARQRNRVMENALGGIAQVNGSGHFSYVNGEFCRIFAAAPEDLLNSSWTDVIAEYERDEMSEAMRESVSNKITEVQCEGKRKDGKPLFLRCKVLPDLSHEPSGGRYLFAEDITQRRHYEEMLQEQNRQLMDARAELQAANERLKELATTDSLTGLRNRREFQEQLVSRTAESKRTGSPLSLLMLDVDRFKTYNDEFGHPAGDEVLKQVAQILQQEARQSDVVGRYGGEEFAMLLPGTGLAGAIALAERCRVAIENFPWKLRKVTASFGCTQFDGQADDVESFVQAADDCLYESKEKGRNRVTPSA